MQDEKEKVFELEDNLDLIVSYNRRTLKKMVNLVMTINKMQMPPSEGSSDLQGDGICSTVMEHVVKGEEEPHKGKY